MERMITSKNMGGVSELTLVADVRPELVEIRSTMTHATRLRILLRTLYGIRRAAVEEGLGPRVPGPLESLEFLHFVRFALLDNDTKFLLSVTFDGAWEPYIRAIAERAGSLLDVIFCHTVGYNALSSDKGYDKFGAFARSRQVEADFWFADSPGTTAKDVALLKDFHRRLSGGGEAALDPRAVGAERIERGLKALHQLYGLDKYFPADHEKAFLRRTAKMILAPITTSLRDHLDHLARLGHDQNQPHEAAFAWAADAPEVRRPAAADLTRPAPRREAAQGNIVTPYAGMTHGATLLLRIEDRARAKAFLRGLAAHDVTREDGVARDTTVNVGLTFEGLRRLGVPPSDLEKLPRPFREGMAARAGWLGDLGPNHPNHWSLPAVNWPLGARPDPVHVRMSSIDLVVQLQARVSDAGDDDHEFSCEHPLHAAIATRFGTSAATGCQLMRVEVTRHLGTRSAGGHSWGLEHFGYLDGVSQPRVDGQGPERDRVALGELLIGHPDDRDGVAAKVALPWLEDGSFQVVRKLRQDVAAFADLIERHRASVPELAERMMGKPLADLERYGLEATPGARRDPLLEVTTPAEVAPLLDFAYPPDATDDDTGVARDSHVRRSNPRNGPDGAARVRAPGLRAVPRIARRGMPYGEAWRPDATNDTGDRGLLFSCFNASLADQFEVIQRWLSGANASGVVGRRSDPFLGVVEPGDRKVFTVHRESGDPVPVELPSSPLVSLEWGLYLFMPSIDALARLTEDAGPDEALADLADLASDADVRAGEAIIRQMEELHRVERARDPERAHFVMQQRWKVLIEDLSRREPMRQVWAAIRARGGALETPYGVLVGSRELIGRIFADRRDYSVSEYWNRMRDSIGELYLGMDPEPQQMAAHANPVARITQDRYLAAIDEGRYAREASVANEWIAAVSEEEAYTLAYGVARGVITGALDATRPVEGVPSALPHATVVDVRDLVDYTVGTMCTPWFGLPDPDRAYQVAATPAPARAHNPDNFKSTARYIFSPNPTGFVRRDGRAKGTELLENARAWVKRFLAPETGEDGRPIPPPSPPLGLFARLLEKREDMERAGIAPDAFADACARVIVGTIHGFVGPVGGTATSLLNQWTENRELWRRQQALIGAFDDPGRALTWSEASGVLLASVEEGMRLQPFPYVLHRTPVKDVVLRQKPKPRATSDGAAPADWDLHVEAGSRVVLGLVSGAHDSKAPEDGAMSTLDMLFGGAYRGGGYEDSPGSSPAGGTGDCGDDRGERDAGSARPVGVHACPGQAIGMGTVVGILTALLQAGNLRRLAPLKLELEPFGYLRYPHSAKSEGGAAGESGGADGGEGGAA